MINLEKEIREQPSVLAGVYSANEKTLLALSDAMHSRQISSVYFAARGTSDHAATYAQYLIETLTGIPCGLCAPSVVSCYGASVHYGKNTLVIGISQSGAAQDVLAVLEDAEKGGALTAAITNYPESPLAKAADYHLFCAAGEEISIAATKTFTSQMMLLALLCAVYSGNKALKAGLDKQAAMAEKLLSYMPETVAGLTKRYTDLKAAVVLGRGFAYPIALEGALKVLETNNIKMRGYPISDFHHGPIAQIHPGDTAFVMALEGAVMENAVQMIGRLKKAEADIIVITDSDAFDADSSLTVLKIPAVREEGIPSDALNVFGTVMVMQLFAAKLTVARGVNPDDAPMLKKVTVTK